MNYEPKLNIFDVLPRVLGKNVNMLMPSPYREKHDDYIGNYVATGEGKMIGSATSNHSRSNNDDVCC